MLRIKITSHVNLGKSLLRNHASGWGMDRNCGANVKYAIHPYVNREVDRNYGANVKHAIHPYINREGDRNCGANVKYAIHPYINRDGDRGTRHGHLPLRSSQTINN